MRPTVKLRIPLAKKGPGRHGAYVPGLAQPGQLYDVRSFCSAGR